MFKCMHSGSCCEDPVTQINLTLGDIKRLNDYTKKSALQLYKEGIIGMLPFSGPGDKFFELEIGLFIPCFFRQHIDKSGFKKCFCYKSRPLNCRLFPYWILAELSKEEIEAIKHHNVCLQNYDLKDFEKEKKIYKKYKDELVKIFQRETKMTDDFLDNNNFRRKIKLKKYDSKEDYREIVVELVEKLKKEDFSEVFKKIDEEIMKIRKSSEFSGCQKGKAFLCIKKHKFADAKEIREIDDFLLI